LGYASSGRKGQVLTKVKPIKLADYMALPFKEYYGQDFGTAAPAGLLGAKFDGNKSWARQINYLPKTALELGILYCELDFNAQDKIVADYADKKTIDLLTDGFTLDDAPAEILQRYPQLRNGFHVVRCVKGTDSVRSGLDAMSSMELYAVEESKDLWNEILNRIYAQDKNGNYTNDPAPGFDHLQDCWMYVIQDRRQGEYFIKKHN